MVLLRTRKYIFLLLSIYIYTYTYVLNKDDTDDCNELWFYSTPQPFLAEYGFGFLEVGIFCFATICKQMQTPFYKERGRTVVYFNPHTINKYTTMGVNHHEKV